MIDAILASIKFLKLPNLSEIMGDHLIRLSELLIQNKIPNDVLLNALSEAQSITNYIDTVKLPEAREGALVLKKSLPRTAASRNH
jgi:hypothetical protein